MRSDMVSELAAQYAHQVARAIVRMADVLSKKNFFFLMPRDLLTIPLRSTGRSRSTYWAHR